mgnify:CR=1 FL=1|jgi:hypothetical protein
MTSPLSKKQICMEGGYMLSNSGNIVLAVFMLLGGLFGMMLSFYLVLCFIQWLSDVVDEKRWLIWKEWLKW